MTDSAGTRPGKLSQRIPILTYHAVREASIGPIARYTVTPKSLGEQLDGFLDAGWRFVRPHHLRQNRTEFAPDERIVMVTVDDGYRDFLSVALPVFESRGITGALFVTSAFVGGQDTWLQRETSTRYPLLSAAQLRETRAAGWEIGVHGATHAELDLVPDDVLANEVVSARNIIGQMIGTAPVTFAYPHGYHARRTRQAVRGAGYEAAYAVSNRVAEPGDDVFAIPRLGITAEMTTADLLDWASQRRTVTADLVITAKHHAWRWRRRAGRIFSH